jgi:hypothetical protein
LSPIVVPAFVVGTLVPGTALGLVLGRAGIRAEWAALLLFCAEIAVSLALQVPCYGAAAYVLLAGRAAYRLDPRLRSVHPALHGWGDIEVPLSAPGVFAGAALAFGLQVGAALLQNSPYPQFAFAAFGLVALGLDRQHAAALKEAGALRGDTGPVLLPHFSVAEHLGLARSSASEVGIAEARVSLKPVLHRRPRHLDDAQRALLARLFARTSG